MEKFGLTKEQSLWLAYHIGQSLYTSGLLTTGRDVMRVIRSRWDQMGCPEETFAEFEKEIIEDDTAFLLSTIAVQRRAIMALAGPCPMGDQDRIS